MTAADDHKAEARQLAANAVADARTTLAVPVLDSLIASLAAAAVSPTPTPDASDDPTPEGWRPASGVDGGTHPVSGVARRALVDGSFPGVEEAACARPEHAHVDFFPEAPPGANRREQRAHAKNVAAAKRVCQRCPVQPPCLAAALATPEVHDHGIQGGTTAKERRLMRGPT